VGSVIYATLVLIVALALMPFFWMLSTSIKSTSDTFIYPLVWIPSPIVWQNYPNALAAGNFLRAFRNTILLVVPTVVGDTASCALVGYGFARIRFPGRNALFIFVISTIMLPREVMLIPTYIVYRELGWLDTFLPFWVPAVLGAGTFYVFLMRQFFLAIPTELDDAARVDGCGTFGIFWRIMLPLAKPALIAISLFSFVANWNDFFRPLIFLTSPEKQPLTLMLVTFQGAFRTDWGQLMAVAVLMMMGPLLIFFFAQRMFIQGIVFTGIKG
jgi:multiple sugar transport system permease protein